MSAALPPLIIEAALNGSPGRRQGGVVPRTPAEIAEDAIRCLEAGASVIHTHTAQAVVGEGAHDPEAYLAAWRPVLERFPDAIFYPTMPVGGSGAPGIEQRYSHVVALADARVLRLGTLDAGSMNLGGLGEDGLPRPLDAVYQNTQRDIRYVIDTCRRLGLGLTASIFEPGFLRTILAYYHADYLPRGTAVKLYFGARPGGFGLPPSPASLEAYLGMLGDAPLLWFVSSIGGDVTREAIGTAAAERGGHLQVGLEPFGGTRECSNASLVEEACALAEGAGRRVATCREAGELLGLAVP